MEGNGALNPKKKVDDGLTDEQRKEMEKIKLLNGLVTPSRVPADYPQSFDLVVVNMQQLLYEGKAKSVIIPVQKDFNLAILPGHTPLFAQIVKGVVTINKEGGQTQEVQVSNGIVRVAQLKVVILIGFADQ